MDRGSGCGVYNIGGGHRVSINSTLETIRRVTGKKLRVKYEPRPAGDPLHTGADITLARDEIGFDPQTSLADGLGEMAVWMDACLSRGL
jgi:UDP-glucose 4-epimerase